MEWRHVLLKKSHITLLVVFTAMENFSQELISSERQETAMKHAEVGFFVSS